MYPLIPQLNCNPTPVLANEAYEASRHSGAFLYLFKTFPLPMNNFDVTTKFYQYLILFQNELKSRDSPKDD